MRDQVKSTVLLAVDPGIRGCGCALFDGSELVRAAYVKSPFADGNRAGEAAAMADAVNDWGPTRVDVLAVEWPQVYASRIRAGASREDPNDLLALAAIDAALSAIYAARTASYSPAEWKGQMPKDVCQARVATRLSAGEQAIVDAVVPAHKRHNVWDAVGLGLHHLGRLQPRTSLSTSLVSR